jgi:hypothetical protein
MDSLERELNILKELKSRVQIQLGSNKIPLEIRSAKGYVPPEALIPDVCYQWQYDEKLNRSFAVFASAYRGVAWNDPRYD